MLNTRHQSHSKKRTKLLTNEAVLGLHPGPPQRNGREHSIPCYLMVNFPTYETLSAVFGSSMNCNPNVVPTIAGLELEIHLQRMTRMRKCRFLGHYLVKVRAHAKTNLCQVQNVKLIEYLVR